MTDRKVYWLKNKFQKDLGKKKERISLLYFYSLVWLRQMLMSIINLWGPLLRHRIKLK